MFLKEYFGKLLLLGVILLSLVVQGPPVTLSAYAQNSNQSKVNRDAPEESNRVIMRVEIKREVTTTQYLEKAPPRALRFSQGKPEFDRSTLIGMRSFEERFLDSPESHEEMPLAPELEPELQMVEVEPEKMEQPRIISTIQENSAQTRRQQLLDVDTDFGHYTPDDFIFFYKKDMSDEQKSALIPFLATDSEDTDAPTTPSGATLIEE